jgi:hypothetical protein
MFNLFVFFSFYLISINGHGYLFEPIARSSAWLVDPSFKTCCTYSGHMEMFCGGVGHQWNTNGCFSILIHFNVRFFFRRSMWYLW